MNAHFLEKEIRRNDSINHHLKEKEIDVERMLRHQQKIEYQYFNQQKGPIQRKTLCDKNGKP